MFVTPKGRKELFLASSLCDGVEDNNLKQVTTLLDDKDADPNIVIPVYGITPFHLAIGNSSESFAEEITKLFLRHGGNPNIRSKEGLTPVHVAAAWGRCKVLELLLSNGGDPFLLDNEGYNPFHFAFDGVHYDAINILRRFCGDSIEEEEEELKYDITLEKLFINNKNLVAEYIVSDEQTVDTNNLSPGNLLEVNIKSRDCSSTSSSQTNLNDHFVTRRRYPRVKREQDQKDGDTPGNINTVFGGKSAQEEKRLVSRIINRLSATFSNDITKTDHTSNDDASLYGRRMKVMPKMSKPSICYKTPENLNRGRLKIDPREERTPVRATSASKSERLQKSSFHKTDATYTALNNSIVSKSPNCNIPSRIEKKKMLGNTPIVNKNALCNSIVSKSPNCGIISSLEKKRKLARTPSFEKNVTSKVVKKPVQKMISRTPCELKSKLYKTNSQKTLQVSKSLPRNPSQVGQKLPQRRASPRLQKQIVSGIKKNNSGVKMKDTEDSSGVYSGSSKASNFKNVAIKLEDRMTEDFDSLSNIDDLQSTRVSESPEREVLISLADDLNTSLENGISQLSGSRSKFRTSDSTGKISNLKYQVDNRDSRFNDGLLDYELRSESNLYNDSLLTMDQSGASGIGRRNENSSGRKNLESLITEDLTARSCSNRPGTESFVSIEEEYKYRDPEEGVTLMERRFCISPSRVLANKEELTSFYTCSTAESVSSLPQEMLLIDKQTLREKLTDLGDNPGPITNSTHRVYLKRLMTLEDKKKIFNNAPPSLVIPSNKPETNLVKSSLLSLNWRKDLESYRVWESEIFQEFARPDPSRKWREGLTKASFNYLLLDSRITQSLPNRAANLSLQEQWETFLSAIFYIGKGKKSRPYAHLYDASHMWISKKPVDETNKKAKRILEIWNDKQGVVVLHVFHNTIPVEAYTREAAMIDALGVEKLRNCKGGEYYGKVATWSNKEKSELGKYLLYKAMEILMVEGERHLFPEDL